MDGLHLELVVEDIADAAPDNGRRIVTCDGCGSPYPAVVTDGDLVLVGGSGGACPNCTGTEFSPLTL